MKVASFTLQGDMRQSVRWKQASEREGFPSVGAWAASALDDYLELRARIGRPLPLSWRRSAFRVLLEPGETSVQGFISEPFYAFRGSFLGPAPTSRVYSLVYGGRIVATLATYVQVKQLAGELAPIYARGDPLPDPGAVIDRHQRGAK